MPSIKLVLIVVLTLNVFACSENTQEKHQIDEVEKSNVVISRSAYQEQIYGFWLGQNIANWTGLITEMDKVGTPATMPFYTDDDWGSEDLPAIWGEGVPHANTIDFFFVNKGEPWGADDDTDIEYMYYHLLDQHQTSILTAQQIREGWLTHIYSETDAPLFKKFPDSKPIVENFLWESNQQARILMAQGMLPPETSEPENNNKYMMIDAQLTTEIFGILAPARPDIALKIAHLPIRTSAYAEAQWISEFYVAMHALAPVVDKSLPIQQQTMWLATQARKQLPDDSYPAKMFDFIKASYSKNLDKNNWEKTRDQVYQRYQVEQADGYLYKDPFEAGINFAASLVSWFYGEGDIVRTIQIGSLAGWDSDNPTATWGGLLGFMIGKSGVELAFKQDNLSDTYWIHRTRRNFPDRTPDQDGEDTFTDMANRGIDIIDRVVVQQMDGKIDLENNVWIIPQP
ncbi:ADP-ribosylglycohydrolase family protein [Thalassomonas sp. M1454]|uniref:ADP-ribosylglycohydrolase family protein n=1 Tax=Thalassomonas sp. M1454 TaxID=2594477 RepID=UPI00117D3E2D|nr:ADP-ribosylglycohydrolase family protein [Thalassomonas sp. M1454]TRX54964.1 ADP-ribosylglycohydrolase family protein [Thalassomonas sp. M1454]